MTETEVLKHLTTLLKKILSDEFGYAAIAKTDDCVIINSGKEKTIKIKMKITD